MSTIVKLLKLLDRRERRNLALLGVAITLMAALEVVGVAAIGPFISVAASPGTIYENSLLSAFYTQLGFTDETAFLVSMGVALVAIIVLTNAYKMFVMYWVYRWSNMRSYSIGRRLLSQYLHQPYAYYLDHNTSELSKNLLTEVRQIVTAGIRPTLEIVARGLAAIAIVLYLYASDPFAALVVSLAIGGTYGLVYFFVRRRLYHIGEDLRIANRDRFKFATEAFAAIKDVKILSKEPVFERLFSRAARVYAWRSAQRQIVGAMPRYAIEAVALGLVVLAVTWMLSAGDEFASVIPLVSVYAFAGYRLLPALQTVFGNLTTLRSTMPMVHGLYDDMMTGSADAEASRLAVNQLAAADEKRLPFLERIRLSDVSFAYASSRSPVLHHITLSIPRLSTVAFVGPTGCGKTTIVDIILGLLPASGSIVVDGQELSHDDIRRWQQNFGYVPQQIFIADDTVRRNIAFGVEPKDVDDVAVERAARIAHLHDFVVTEMPDGYDTVVGERGIRISGGQRQRVGIARALYHDPDILILDEATSALDNMTEEAVMDAIHELMGEKTIIMIAHRLTTIQEADRIFLMDRGRILQSGTYEELLESSDRFREMARQK